MTERVVLLVRATADGVEGWGECSALERPTYSSEWVDGAELVIRQVLGPMVLDRSGEPLTAGRDVALRLATVSGHRMAKAAIEMAITDLELRAAGVSLADHLGAVRAHVDAGIVIGEQRSVPALLDAVAEAEGQGYRRVKLKIRPGHDIDWVTAARATHPDLALWVDANGAYSLADTDHLRRLDDLDVALIEQPLPPDELDATAEFAQSLGTPVCLDEPLVSLATTRHAVDLGACTVVNLKPGRVGGLSEAVAIHNWCRDHGVAMWIGGMLETGIGRAANVALAAMAGVTLTSDLSASERFYRHDVITEPFTLSDGNLTVPTGPGLGVEIDRDRLDEFTETIAVITP